MSASHHVDDATLWKEWTEEFDFTSSVAFVALRVSILVLADVLGAVALGALVPTELPSTTVANPTQDNTTVPLSESASPFARSTRSVVQYKSSRSAVETVVVETLLFSVTLVLAAFAVASVPHRTEAKTELIEWCAISCFQTATIRGAFTIDEIHSFELHEEVVSGFHLYELFLGPHVSAGVRVELLRRRTKGTLEFLRFEWQSETEMLFCVAFCNRNCTRVDRRHWAYLLSLFITLAHYIKSVNS